MKTGLPILIGTLLGVACITADFIALSNYDELMRSVREAETVNDTNLNSNNDSNNNNNASTDTTVQLPTTTPTPTMPPTDPNRQLELRNKKVVLGFMNEFFGDKNIEAAPKYISTEKYIQHNPFVADGLEAVMTAAKVWFKGEAKEKMDIKRISAEGDLVWVHYKAKFSGKPQAVIDIFRLENEKIVEHWDVIQEVPDKAANDHPMF